MSKHHPLHLDTLSPAQLDAASEWWSTSRAAAPARRNLPRSMPLADLTPEQITALAEWWSEYTDAILDHLRDALAYTPAPGVGTRRPANPLALRTCVRNAVAIIHLLRLHPACDKSPAALAHELECNRERLSLSISGIAPILDLSAPTRRRSTVPGLKSLRGCYPELDWTRREGRPPLLTVPFALPLTIEEQWATVRSIADLPGLAVTLFETAEGANAVRIRYVHKPGTPLS